MDLADEYIKFEKTITPETTVDDFFDHCNIPVYRRSNFVFAAIMKQVLEKEKGNKIEEDRKSSI